MQQVIQGARPHFLSWKSCRQTQAHGRGLQANPGTERLKSQTWTTLWPCRLS